MKLRHFIRPLFTIAALVVAFSVYGAWYTHVGKESALAVSLAGQVAEAQQKGARAEEAKQQLAQAASDEAATQEYFVRTPDDVVTFLETLQKTGTKLGTKVEVASVSSQPAQPHTQLQLSLSITGSFDGILRTLGAIEYEPYDTVVKSVTLDTAGAGGPGAPQWSAAVTMLVGTIDATKAVVRPAAPVASTTPPTATVATTSAAAVVPQASTSTTTQP